MQLTGKITGIDEKLDGLLSLMMHEFEEASTVPLALFHNRYGDLFGEDLDELQEILFEDGLIRGFVGPEGLSMEITPKGSQFMARGGYSREIREEMISHEDALRAQKAVKNWNRIVIAGFVVAMVICFYLRHRSS
ncbi:MAG: hypothetical protein Q8918_01115 [Bacteroidota bacterium]|nr:hypothetical protein [Bacteroidota bacterium]MDP4212607.1 hypothetical protein [Bacteroidota bacterium]MDP4248687.1 hypothetical protein [Bacteroidota bacterium]